MATFASYRASMALHIGMVTPDSAGPRTLTGLPRPWPASWSAPSSAPPSSAPRDTNVVTDDDGAYVMLNGASTKDLTAEVVRLVGVGANVIEGDGVSRRAWTVLSGPNGNVFGVGAEE
jgi:hypothetical protein